MGRYKSSPQTSFFVTEFVEVVDDKTPSPEAYITPIAALHGRSMGRSPTGMFGCAVNIRFGNMEQRIGWSPSWEEFWTTKMRQFIDREERVGGSHDAELVQLKHVFLEKVFPRYLGPLESEGRIIKPCLLHGDLWPRNVKYKPDLEAAWVHDSSAL